MTNVISRPSSLSMLLRRWPLFRVKRIIFFLEALAINEKVLFGMTTVNKVPQRFHNILIKVSISSLVQILEEC